LLERYPIGFEALCGRLDRSSRALVGVSYCIKIPMRAVIIDQFDGCHVGFRSRVDCIPRVLILSDDVTQRDLGGVTTHVTNVAVQDFEGLQQV
jgi:hypothetical protein